METSKNYFNLEEFMKGKPATTKLGNPAKFITISRDKMLVNVNHRCKVVGFSKKEVANQIEGTVEKYNLNGRKYNGTETAFDLIMIPNK